MKNDYIEIGDKKYRVEFNWNTIVEFLESEELTLNDVDNLKNLRPGQITGLIYAGVREGCSMDNTEFPYSKTEFSRMITPVSVGELLLIYTRQTTATKTETRNTEPETKKKKFQNPFRSKSFSG